MIRSVLVRNPFDQGGRELFAEEAGRARTAGDLLPQAIDRTGLIVWRNGARSSIDAPALDGDWFAFIVRPQDFGATALLVLQNLLVAAAVTLAAQLLFPAPGPPKSRSDEDSPVYGFSGLSNIRVEGLPIAVVYGTMRLGGTIIAEFTRVRNIPPETVLYMLISFGEGPFKSIAGLTFDSTTWRTVEAGNFPQGITIEDNLAENYPRVEAMVRMGSNEQTAIDEFHELVNAFTVGLPLLALETIFRDNSFFQYGGFAGTPQYADFFTTAGDATFATYQVAFDFAEDFDAATIRLAFEEGLFAHEDDGDAMFLNFVLQARYIELDSGGTPITVGGPIGDGYVRLPPLFLVGIHQQGFFEIDHTVRFYDKATYTPPALGKCLDCEGSTSQHARATTNASFPFVAADLVDKVTIELWFNAESLPAATATAESINIFGNYTSGDRRGISLGLLSRTDIAQGGFNWVPAAFFLNSGGGSNDFIAPSYTHEVLAGGWHSIAVTIEKDADGVSEWVRLFYDGEEVAGEFQDLEIRWGAGNYYWARNVASLFTYDFDGQLDDTLIFHRVLPPNEIRTRYANGGGVYGSTGTELRGWFHWDNGANQSLGSGNWWGNATLFNGATAGVTAGHILGAETATPKRGRYRVECARVNVDSTNSQARDDAKWSIVYAILDELLAYPNSPLLALKIPASETLNTSTPKVLTECQAVLCPIWNQDSTTFPTFSFFWSANPAAVALDLLTNLRYGLGKFYEGKQVDLEEWQAWANYCHEIVYDGSPKHGPDTDGDWVNLYYFNDTQDGDGDTRGSIWIVFDIAPQTVNPPDEWEVGEFVRFHGVQVIGSDPDINQGTFGSNTSGGYEIANIMYGGTHGAISLGTVWIVEVYWDRLAEGDPWPTETRHDASAGEATEGIATGGERRFQFDGSFDAQMGAWDALLEIARVGRAVPIRDGKRIRFKFARPRSPIAVIGMGSIMRGIFKIAYRNGASSPNQLEAGFLDKDHGYERSTTTGTHVSVPSDEALENLRIEHTFLFGVTSRGQATRACKFQVNMYQELLRSGSFTLGPEALHLEPGDVVRIAHDILPRTIVESGGKRYPEMVSGRAMIDSPVNDRIISDRDFHIDGTKSYRVYWTDLVTGQFNSPRVHEGTTGVGVHSAGDPIYFVVGDEPPDPIPKDTVFLLAVEGEELDVEISRITLEPDFTRRCEWVEYKESIYDDELDEESQDALLSPGPDYGSNGRGTAGFADLIPNEPEITIVDDSIVKGRGGVFEPVLRVAWSHDRATILHVGGTAIFVRKDLGAWRQVYTIDGTATQASFPVHGLEAGAELDVAVQTRSHGGKRRQPNDCPKRRHSFSGIGAYPGAPTAVAAHMIDDKVVYSWTLPVGQEGNVVECRRGGWILAPVVFVSGRGALTSEPTRDWAGATAGDPTLYFRCRNEIGQYSEAATLAFTPTARVDTFALPTSQNDQAWEAFVDGWVSDMPAVGNATLVGLVRHASGYVEFDGSSLTGVYTIADPESYPAAPISMRVPRRAYLEACLVAEQMHPITWGMAEFDWGNPKFLRWTWEGPTHVLPNETANVSVRIEVRVNTSGTNGDWSPWREYRPGLASVASVQWRVTFVRPNTSYQIRMHSFRTRVRGTGIALQDRTPFQALLGAEVFG